MWRVIVTSMALGVWSGCSGCNKAPTMPKDVCLGIADGQEGRGEQCAQSSDCQDHYGCRDVREKTGVKCCVFVNRACEGAADCCPGQNCVTVAGTKRCSDQRDTCTVDADCESESKPGRVCEVYTDRNATEKRCRYRPCGPLGECAEGLTCFQGECISGQPCGGSCPAGAACVPSAKEDAQCQPYTSPTRMMGACPVTCSAGFIATFRDNRNIWDSCVLPQVQCVCAELPGLTSDDLGRFSAIAAEPTKAIYVSQYDGKYGDLVVAKFGLDGKRQALEYVDGVPQGTATFGPSGARGGVEAPGPDVGRYTDVAVARNGTVFVSYYDVGNGDLKVAIRGTDGTWSSSVVDGAQGDVGQYSSIAIDSDGFAGVAYFQRGGDTGFAASDCPAPAPTGPIRFITALKFARAASVRPSQPSDWQVKTVACLSRPTPPCDGCMGVCADTGSGPQCFREAMGCSPTCSSSSEKCVQVGAQSRCGRVSTPTPLQDLPVGVGLFASLAFAGKDGIIAYQQRSIFGGSVGVDGGAGLSAPDGDLFGVRLSANNTPGTPVLLDGVGDTGYFPDVKIDPVTQAIAISYHDSSTKSLKYFSAAALQLMVTPEVVDRGVDRALPGQQSFVGTDSAIVFGPAGAVYVVYQDATRGDLKLAKRGSSWQVLPSPSTSGAVGFFADGVFSDGAVFASHARLKATAVGGVPGVQNALLLERLTPP